MKDFTLVKTIKFTLNDKRYRTTIYRTKSNSNYNIFVAVYKIGDRTALVGTTFKSDYSDAAVKTWSEGAIKRYNTESTLQLV